MQLEIIQFLHKARTPLLDHAIKLLDFFDRQEFFFIIIPMVWLGLGWRFGLKIFYLFALSSLTNHGLKNLFALPRPLHFDPALGIIQVKGYGFPSGAAQSAILVSGLLILYWKSRWKWGVAVTYTLLLSFSRIYLGVHFPTDIVGGWIVGFMLLGVYVFFFPKIERFFERRSPLNALLISSLLLIALTLLFPSKNTISICGCAIGLGIGIFIIRKVNFHYSTPKTKLDFLTKSSIGVPGVFLIYGLASTIFHFQSPVSLLLLFVAIGLWVGFGALYLCGQFSVPSSE